MKHKPQGLTENIKVAKLGGHAAKVARDDIEKNLGENVVTKNNSILLTISKKAILDFIEKKQSKKRYLQ